MRTTVFCSFGIELLEHNIVEHNHLNTTRNQDFRREFKPNTWYQPAHGHLKTLTDSKSLSEKSSFVFLQISVGFCFVCFLPFMVLQGLVRILQPLPMERLLQGMNQTRAQRAAPRYPPEADPAVASRASCRRQTSLSSN